MTITSGFPRRHHEAVVLAGRSAEGKVSTPEALETEPHGLAHVEHSRSTSAPSFMDRLVKRVPEPPPLQTSVRRVDAVLAEDRRSR